MKYNDKRNKNASKCVIGNEDHSYARVLTFEGQKIMNEVAKKVFNQLYNN
jgi:hypothetical protein